LLLPLFDSKRPSWEKWVRSRNILAISKNIYTAHFIIWNRNYTFWKNNNTTIRKIPKETFEANSNIASEYTGLQQFLIIARMFLDLTHFSHEGSLLSNRGNNKITELRTILQRESQNS
jgi:DMSO/TMAO reductase YedYZ heme-binding membrane subunit